MRIRAVMSLVAGMALAGCSALTVAPKPVEAHQASLDGNAANSGLLGRLPDGGWELTPGAIARYNGLIGAGYGVSFIPALHQGDGYKALADGNYEMDGEHLAKFGVMATAYRSKAP